MVSSGYNMEKPRVTLLKVLFPLVMHHIIPMLIVRFIHVVVTSLLHVDILSFERMLVPLVPP